MKKTILIVLAAIMSMAAKAQTYYGTVTPICLEAGQKSALWFNMVNEGIDFTALQFDITLPEGFCFAYKEGRGGVRTYETPTYSVERANEHTFDDNSVSNNGRTMSIIGHSKENENFYNTTYPADERTFGLIQFNIMADKDVQPGLYHGKVTGIVFATQEQVAYKSPDASFSILVKGDGTTVTLNVSQAGVATLILPFDAALPEGLQAWTCDALGEDGVIETTSQTGIPANTPLVITGTPGEYVFTGTPQNAQSQYTAGALTGTYDLLNVGKDEGYVLQNHQGEVAFYHVDAVDGENILPYRCYIPAGKGAAGVRAYFLTADGQETAIGGMDGRDDGKAYDLTGRRASKRQSREIQIINSKKVVKK